MNPVNKAKSDYNFEREELKNHDNDREDDGTIHRNNKRNNNLLFHDRMEQSKKLFRNCSIDCSKPKRRRPNKIRP